MIPFQVDLNWYNDQWLSTPNIPPREPQAAVAAAGLMLSLLALLGWRG